MSDTNARPHQPEDAWVRYLPWLLVAATMGIYGRVASHAFLNYDDPLYITLNPHVQAGLDPTSIRWAFANFDSGNWQPVDWLSHMADVELFGLSAGAHHLVNAGLHSIAALMLFWFFRRTTGAPIRSFFVAALFALHPLNVQPVAWIAQRKDVLSACFFAAGLIAYARYTERPGFTRYATVALALTAGLLTKPVLVTFPFVLLLIDAWPLRRWSPGHPESISARRLIVEKLPLLALSAAASIVTLAAQGSAGAIRVVPLEMRLANAAVSYASYTVTALWPTDLSIHHPYRLELLDSAASLAWVASAVVALTAVTAGAIAWGRRHRYGIVGWLWFLGMLVPMAGFVQAGHAGMADRYFYLPGIGLFVSAVWATHAVARSRNRERAAVGAGFAVLVLLAATSAAELRHWRDSRAVFERALELAPESVTAHNQLGLAYFDAGETAAAIEQFQRATQLDPENWRAHHHLGNALRTDDRFDEAVDALAVATRLAPGVAAVRSNYGRALVQAGHPYRAVEQYERVLQRAPGSPQAHLDLADALLRLGNARRAVTHYEQAVRLVPDAIDIRIGLARALQAAGRGDEAVAQLEALLEVSPGNEALEAALMESRSPEHRND